MTHLPPPVHGAALRNKSLLDSKLINDQFNIYNLPLRFAEDLTDIGSFSIKKLFAAISYCFRLIAVLITRKIDLAYFTMSPKGGAFYRDILFITVLKLFRKKVLLHFRVKGIQQTANSRIGRMLVRFAFRHSDVVCLSRHHIEDLNGFITRAPFVVPNGIKIEEYRFGFQNAQPHPPVILFLSNLMKTKGIDELVNALQILHKKNIQFQAIIAGKEFDLSYVELHQLIGEKKMQDLIKVLGPVYGEEKFRLIASADLFVLPTYFELFPGVILEAMQFGRPIISTFEGSIPEMIDNGVNGMLVPPKDAQSLANAMMDLMADPAKRERMGKAAKEKFFNEFTLDKFEKNMRSVFDAVINKQRTPRHDL